MVEIKTENGESRSRKNAESRLLRISLIRRDQSRARADPSGVIGKIAESTISMEMRGRAGVARFPS
jgi:hypothetical protein